MDKREQILSKYQEFNQYLESIDLHSLKQEFSRQELNEFKTQLYNIKLRSLAYEVGEMTKKMKVEEFPQLLGVHNFPIINEIDFLSEKQKLELDKFLVMHRVGNYVYNFWKVVSNDKIIKQLESWLEQKEVIEKCYAVVCPNCCEGHLSKTMPKIEKEKLEKTFVEYKISGDYDLWEKLKKLIPEGCMECDDVREIDEINELRFKDYYIMKVQRDTSLDNV